MSNEIGRCGGGGGGVEVAKQEEARARAVRVQVQVGVGGMADRRDRTPAGRPMIIQCRRYSEVKHKSTPRYASVVFMCCSCVWVKDWRK